MNAIGTATILRADARALPLADASVDAIVCDPPYALPGGFMGRSWDRFDEPRAFQDWCEVWAREAYRVLKPGGFLLSFGGTRTYHRLTCAIEDAGFEIRDSIGYGHMAWTFGQGFAKGLDVSKAIDAHMTTGGSRPEDLRRHRMGEEYTPTGRGRINYDMPGGNTLDGPPPAPAAPATDEARRWQGWNTSLKPAWEPIVVARKPLIGTVVDNVLAHGTGALNIDGCRLPAGGRWPTNVVLSHVPKLDEQGEIVGDACADGCVADCPVAELDAQSGVLTSGANPTRRGSPKFADAYGEFVGRAECVPARGADEGGASRFFPTFRYEAKAPADERPRVDGVAHPTVKPLTLIRFLARLVTRPGGLILDMFGGSGTTAEAALLEGFNVIVSENDADYLPLIQYRIDRARRRMQPGIARLGKAKPTAQTDGQGDLLADLFGGDR